MTFQDSWISVIDNLENGHRMQATGTENSDRPYVFMREITVVNGYFGGESHRVDGYIVDGEFISREDYYRLEYERQQSQLNR
jgi:hypothetical protein